MQKTARIKIKRLLILSLERERITRQGGSIGHEIGLEAWLGLKLGSIYRGLLSSKLRFLVLRSEATTLVLHL